MATYKEVNHNSGPPVSSHYAQEIVDADGYATITAGAALNGTAYGLQIRFFGSNIIRLEEALPSGVLPATGEYRLRVRYDPNGLTRDGATFNVNIKEDAISQNVAIINFVISTGQVYNVSASFLDDSDNLHSTSGYVLTNEPHCLEIAVRQSSDAVTGDATLEFYIDGVLQETVSGSIVHFNKYNNADTLTVQKTNNGTGTDGAVYVDEILIDDDASAALCAAAATPFRFLGMAADNGSLYVTGLKDEATLKLFTYTDLATLAESGTASFGAATDTELDDRTRGIFPVVRPDGDGVLYLFGRDGNNVQAQYNDANGTLGWTDIGPGTATWGTAKYAVALMPAPTAPDDVIIAFADDDVYRARFGTATWVKMGDATSGLRAAVRHPVRFNELLAGGTAAGAVWFSHNFGVSWSDVGGTIVGTVNAFEVSL